MNITVIRDAGDKSGASISEQLLTTTAAGAERARVEIDTQYYDKYTVDTTVNDFSYLANGSFIGARGLNLVQQNTLLTGISADYKAGEAPTIVVTTERLEG